MCHGGSSHAYLLCCGVRVADVSVLTAKLYTVCELYQSVTRSMSTRHATVLSSCDTILVCIVMLSAGPHVCTTL
jgi:hypothetical protein